MTTTLTTTIHRTALATLEIEANDVGITRIAFSDKEPTAEQPEGHIADAIAQIEQYLAGERRDFTLSLDWSAVGAFDATVLHVLDATVGYGQTISYGRLAASLGRSDARKIGGAMARNRFPVVVPCHRVLGATGDLTGYAGGLVIKRALLDLESTDLILDLGR
ncbi:methylated-DNA--[protein]-cysteine S-methyltransferase [Antrihabitans cavernicola]|uniref:methylated-DNA--[protein]-cysteine S-methyltransferase n=1 Tax=Antrihabitans cavernicola TaxID=2495913 RepID=A0A5A7SJ84_9NOCA|nr:methylated-DNA--[protein]-cysteine S-methyltransferase [Spelaeibacter cavernicola]KAA0024807.1 methylated-DNA--[protein]-cysteine S-methyltransferase [Spelaeibacter cavernicola]